MTTDAERLAAALADRYTVERELGAGGMATVYLATDLRHNRKVAIKVLRPELAAALGLARFAQEIEIAARLTHPHILPVHDSGEAGGFLFYVMPYVDGESLRERLNRERELPIPESVRLLAEISDALAYAHSRGVVHRDIKPENVMLSGRHALVMDFGVAKAVSEASSRGQLTTAGVALGTPAYMAPEQATADPLLDHRADIYALGVVGYELLAGQPPFAGASPQQLLAAHVTQTPAPLSVHRPSISPALAHVIMRALEKRPADRWQTAEEMHAQLEPLATPSGGATAAAAPSPIADRGGSRATAGRWRWIAAAIAVFALGGAWVFAPHGTSARVAASGRTIAVLPIDVNGDSLNEPFAEGISDGVRNDLNTMSGLRVIGRTSSLVFGRTASAQDVRKRISNVDVVLQGALSRAGSRLHLVASLDDAADGRQLWGTTIDLDVKDLYAVQDSIKHAIVSALQIKLADGARDAHASGRTAIPAAYTQYLLGRHELNQLQEATLHRALAHFDTAVKLDPGYAQAYAGSSEAWSYLADEYLAPDSSYPQMKAAAERAVALDSMSAEAHAALGMADAWSGLDARKAEAEFRHAVALDPNAVAVREVFANLLLLIRPADGVLQADRAIELDPLSPFASWARAACLYAARRYDEAIIQARRTRELAPNLVYYDVVEAASYRELRNYDEAVRLYREAQPNSNKPLFGLGVTFARMGLRDSALRVARDLEALAKRRYVTPYLIAMVYANLPGATDRDLAFKWLQEGRRVHSAALLFLNTIPDLDGIRGDPRFAEVGSAAGAR